MNAIRRAAYRFVPKHFDHPVAVAKRVLSSGAPAARFAILLAALGIAASPIDVLLQRWEKQRYREAAPPSKPILFICGPPRSGTTLLALSVIRSMEVTFINNVASVFPLSPIQAGRMMRIVPRSGDVDISNYYGRTHGFNSPNDALFLWDRWLGEDRTRVATELSPEKSRGMIEFFGAYEAWTGLPLVNKANSLNAHASLIAPHLPTARFIFVKRDPLFLAQSLLTARRVVTGDPTRPYGLHDPATRDLDDPYRDVALQVAFHARLAAEQRSALGADRFQEVEYEKYCADPLSILEEIASSAGIPLRRERIPGPQPQANTVRLPHHEFESLERAVAREVFG